MKEKPLSWLGVGLVRSLSKIEANRVSSKVLESYSNATEQRLGGLPQCTLSLRLFRYGIRYLISKNPTDLIELIQPERDILKQALGLT